MDLAVATLRPDGYEAWGEDVVGLSPLDYSHVNMLGRYEFALPNSIAGGAFRPLRDQQASDDGASSAP